MLNLVTSAVHASLAYRYVFLAAVILFIGFAAAAFAIADHTDNHISVMLRDANAIGELPFYFAALEMAGILMMAGTAFVLLFTSTISMKEWRPFLIGFGALTAALCLDDAYLLHENAWRVGLSEKKVYLIYFISLLLILATNPRRAMETPLVFLGVSLAALAGSAVIDSVEALEQLAGAGGEDLLELLAFSVWTGFFLSVCHIALRRAYFIPAGVAHHYGERLMDQEVGLTVSRSSQTGSSYRQSLCRADRSGLTSPRR